MSPKTTISIFILCLLANVGVCSNSELDSLKKIYYFDIINDSSKISALIDIAYLSLDENEDSFQYYNDVLTQYSTEKKSAYGLMWASWNKADYFETKNMIDSSVLYRERAVKIGKKIPDNIEAKKLQIKLISYCNTYLLKGKAYHYINQSIKENNEQNNNLYLGVAYADLGYHYKYYYSAYDEALIRYQRADSILSTIDKNHPDLGNVLVGIGTIYFETGDLENARLNFESAKKVFLSNNRFRNVEKANRSLSEIDIRKGNFQDAIYALKQSLVYFENDGQVKHIEITKNLLGKAYLANGQYDLSIKTLKEALDLSYQDADTIKQLNNLYLLAKANFEKNDVLLSKRYLKECLTVAELSNEWSNKEDAYALLSQINIKQKDYKNAFENLTKHVELKDSLNEIKNIENFQKLEARYQSKKKESEITLLKVENQLSNSELDRKKAIQTRLIVLAMLLGLGLAFLWYWMYTKRKLREVKFNLEMQGKSEMIDALQDRLNKILNSQPSKSDGNLVSIEELNALIQFPLSEREYDVLSSIADGNTNSEASKKLFISENTVKFHLKNIYIKLEVSNRVQALNRVKK